MGTIDDVKAALDIVETVRGYVPALKRSGRTWKAPCPFHSERTPSFSVDPERRTWHCFGACATGGDVIEFVRRFEHLEFVDALRRCAERAGVELRAPNPREQREREVHERLLRANEAAAVFFQAALTGPAGAHALAYAEGRGLDAQTRDTWQLGYAPDEWRGLTEHLQARGFTDADLREAGLAIEGDRGLYDRFRDRLIFPTRDARGRMIGFGARALTPGQEPKYLNTSQTPLFDKSGSVYGIDRAGEEARRADRIVVVEGYMDVIACHQAGIRNVVASMGTSITEKQIELIKRYTQNIVLMLDSDAAGDAATLRGQGVVGSTLDTTISIADVRDRSVTLAADGSVQRVSGAWVPRNAPYQAMRKFVGDIRVVALPAGEDPDSLVRKDPEQLRALIAKAPLFIEHLFETMRTDSRLEDTKGQSEILFELAPFVSAVPDPATRAHFVHQLGLLTGIAERDAFDAVLRSSSAVRALPVPSPREVTQARREVATVPDGEAQLLMLLLLRPEARAAGRALDADVFEDGVNRRLFEAWLAGDDVVSLDVGAIDATTSDPGAIDTVTLETGEDLSVRVTALRAAAIGSWDPANIDPKHVATRVEEIARLLRLRRAQARLLPAALAQATEVAEARRGGLPAAEVDELEAGLVAMDARQRVLSRRARGQTTSYHDESMASQPVTAGDPRVEVLDDTDV